MFYNSDIAERSQGYNDEKKFNLLNFLVANQVELEYRRISRRYKISERLNADQGDIFEKYFLSYRLLKDKVNSGILDQATEVETEMYRKMPIIGSMARITENIAESIREVSRQFRERGDELAKKYSESLTEGSGMIIPSKLQRVANMMNVYLIQERDPKQIEQIINNYLDREMPKLE